MFRSFISCSRHRSGPPLRRPGGFPRNTTQVAWGYSGGVGSPVASLDSLRFLNQRILPSRDNQSRPLLLIHGLRSDQGRFPGALPLGVRLGARAFPRGHPSSREPSAGKISQARSVYHRRHGAQHLAAKKRRNPPADHHASYENRSTPITSNRPIEEWGKLLSDVPVASAILDRLLHHAEVIAITGRSYRLQDSANQRVSPKPKSSPQRQPTNK